MYILPVHFVQFFNFIKKETPAQMFSSEFFEISKNTFFNDSFTRVIASRTKTNNM